MLRSPPPATATRCRAPTPSILALRFTVLQGVIDEIAGPLAGQLVVVPSNPLTIDAHGSLSRVLPDGQSSGKVVAGWLPAGARLAMAFGTLSADLFVSASNRSPSRRSSSTRPTTTGQARRSSG